MYSEHFQRLVVAAKRVVDWNGRNDPLTYEEVCNRLRLAVRPFEVVATDYKTCAEHRRRLFEALENLVELEGRTRFTTSEIAQALLEELRPHVTKEQG